MPLLERELSIPQVPEQLNQLSSAAIDFLLLLGRAVSFSLPTTRDFLDAGLAAYAVGIGLGKNKMPGAISGTFLTTLIAKRGLAIMKVATTKGRERFR